MCQLWAEQSHTLVSRPSLAQGVTGEEVRNSCCFIDESNSRVYGSKIHPSRGRGLGSWSCQGMIRSDHRSPEIIGDVWRKAGLQADL